MQVAETILKQLGGNQFIAMTGSSNFGATDNSLQMKLTRNKLSASHLIITLNSMDTYDLEFFSIRKFEKKSKKSIEGVYSDQLRSIFTKETGLYTSL